MLWLKLNYASKRSLGFAHGEQLVYWGHNKMGAISQMTFSNVHFYEWKLLYFYQNFVEFCS